MLLSKSVNPEKIMKERKVRLPRPYLFKLLRLLMALLSKMAGVKYVYHFDKKEMKGKQVFLLSDHASRRIYSYTIFGYPFVVFNVVMGYHNAYNVLFPLFAENGVIFKRNFDNDIKPLRDIFRALKMGGSILLYPEGLQSVDGTAMPISPQTADLIKRAGIPVVLCKSYGAYLTQPDFSSKPRKGHQELHYEILFQPEELKTMTKEEVYERLMDRFCFDDSEWNKEAKYTYSSKEGLADGLDKILYHCPKCHREFALHTIRDRIHCRICDNRIRITPTYLLTAEKDSDVAPWDTIHRWSRAQRQMIREEIKKADFSISYEADCYRIKGDQWNTNPYEKCGEGELSVDHNGIHYKGTRNGSDVEIEFSLGVVSHFGSYKGVPGNCTYYNGEFFGFAPKERSGIPEKMRLAVSELNRMQKEQWNQALKAIESRDKVSV